MSYDPQDRAQSVRVGVRLDLCDFKASFRLMSGRSQAGGKPRVQKSPARVLKCRFRRLGRAQRQNLPPVASQRGFILPPLLKFSSVFHTQGRMRQVHTCTHGALLCSWSPRATDQRHEFRNKKGKRSPSKSWEFLTECLNLHRPLPLPEPFNTVRKRRNNTCASAYVHIHKGKLLSTSNQGPNQHPIAHPHNLSLHLSLLLISFPFPLPLPRTSLPAFFRSLIPPSRSSLGMAAAGEVAAWRVKWGSWEELLGIMGAVQTQPWR